VICSKVPTRHSIYKDIASVICRDIGPFGADKSVPARAKNGIKRFVVDSSTIKAIPSFSSCGAEQVSSGRKSDSIAIDILTSKKVWKGMSTVPPNNTL
jgi:hypothetical protein